MTRKIETNVVKPETKFEHATSMLSSTAPFRFTVQLFWKIQNE